MHCALQQLTQTHHLHTHLRKKNSHTNVVCVSFFVWEKLFMASRQSHWHVVYCLYENVNTRMSWSILDSAIMSINNFLIKLTSISILSLTISTFKLNEWTNKKSRLISTFQWKTKCQCWTMTVRRPFHVYSGNITCNFMSMITHSMVWRERETNRPTNTHHRSWKAFAVNVYILISLAVDVYLRTNVYVIIELLQSLSSSIFVFPYIFPKIQNKMKKKNITKKYPVITNNVARNWHSK